MAKEAGGSIAAIVGSIINGPPKLPPPGSEPPSAQSAADVLSPLSTQSGGK